MAKRKRSTDPTIVKMDMTPMIDCVFQLIIFFFLIIDLQNQDLELLVLPKADFAVPDEPPPGWRPILNVHQNGRIVYKQRDYFDPDKPNDWGSLEVLLRDFASKMKHEMDPVVKKSIPYDPMLIRADEWTEMHHVAKIMEKCGHESVMIWKIELALGERKDGKTAADFIPAKN
ncbi:MAG: biopolymer transporter ExbD [Planctomycetota bacterium]